MILHSRILSHEHRLTAEVYSTTPLPLYPHESKTGTM